MPELPEVETVCRELSKSLTGEKIESVQVFCPRLRNPLPDSFAKQVAGLTVQNVQRRGKYLIVNLNNNRSLLIHLGMTGKLLLKDKDSPPEKHDHIVFAFKDKVLVYNDVRRFGLVALYDSDSVYTVKSLRDMGQEPLSDSFTGLSLQAALKGKKASIKTCLLDQGIVAGLGNIYVCEALFQSRISPLRAGDSLTDKEAELLCRKIKEILTESIACGGTTFRDYRHSDGSKGEFVAKLFVYGKAGQKCSWCDFADKCGGVIKTVQGGRSTFYCPLLQK